MDYLYTIAIIYVIIISFGFLVVRKYYPKLLSSEKQYQLCTKCNNGVLKPYLKWWRYFFILVLPPTVFLVIGKANAYQCTNCLNRVSAENQNRCFTRVYLSQNAPSLFSILAVGGFILFIMYLFFT